MSNIESRLKRLEALVGRPEPISAWDGYDPAAQSAMSEYALSVASAVSELARQECRVVEPFDHDEPNEVQLAVADAVEVIRLRLEREGLLAGPLDEAQLERTQAISDEFGAKYDVR